MQAKNLRNFYSHCLRHSNSGEHTLKNFANTLAGASKVLSNRHSCIEVLDLGYGKDSRVPFRYTVRASFSRQL